MRNWSANDIITSLILFFSQESADVSFLSPSIPNGSSSEPTAETSMWWIWTPSPCPPTKSCGTMPSACTSCLSFQPQRKYWSYPFLSGAKVLIQVWWSIFVKIPMIPRGYETIVEKTISGHALFLSFSALHWLQHAHLLPQQCSSRTCDLLESTTENFRKCLYVATGFNLSLMASRRTTVHVLALWWFIVSMESSSDW